MLIVNSYMRGKRFMGNEGVYKLTAFLNISYAGYHKFKKEELFTEREKIINQLIDSDLKLKVPFKDYGEYHFKIEYISSKDAFKEELLKSIEKEKIMYINNPQSFLNSNLLKITINNIEVPSYIPENTKKEWNDFDPLMIQCIENDEIVALDFNKALIYEIFHKRVQDLIFACNISNFGSISIEEYVIFQDKGVYLIGGGRTDYNILFEARQSSLIWQYPNLTEIRINKVWDWLIKRSDFLEGYSQSAVTRALLNLLEVANSETNMKLFRAVMGIEGLYTKSKNNLMEQVREKTQILLGEQENFKKMYSKMYEFRSKFIHGELNFPTKINIEFSKRQEDYIEDLSKVTHFAILLLGASIQQLIINDWHEIQFEYIVKGTVD